MVKRSFIALAALFLLAPFLLLPLWRFALQPRPHYLSLLEIPFDPIHDLESTLHRPIVWLGILLVLMGMQFVTMGLLGELLVRTYHESQGKPVYRVGALLGLAARGRESDDKVA